jgi:hypothetical protein
MQPLKRAEYPLGVRLIEPDSPVFNDDPALWMLAQPMVRRRSGPNGDIGRFTVFVEFKRVAYQILEQLAHLNRVRLDDRQVGGLHVCRFFRYDSLEIGDGILHGSVEIDRDGGFAHATRS